MGKEGKETKRLAYQWRVESDGQLCFPTGDFHLEIRLDMYEDHDFAPSNLVKNGDNMETSCAQNIWCQI